MYLENSHSGRNGSCSVARAVSKSTTRCVLRSVLRGTVRRSLVSTCEVHTRELAAKFTGRCVICLCRSCFVGESERSKPVAFSLYANRSETAKCIFLDTSGDLQPVRDGLPNEHSWDCTAHYLFCDLRCVRASDAAQE